MESNGGKNGFWSTLHLIDKGFAKQRKHDVKKKFGESFTQVYVQNKQFSIAKYHKSTFDDFKLCQRLEAFNQKLGFHEYGEHGEWVSLRFSTYWTL